MAGFSFSSTGSTPQNNSFLGGYLSGNQGTNSLGSSPYAKALSNSTAPNMSTNQGPRYVAPPVPISPSTPVKKQTIANVDGSTHTIEYHKPEPGLIGSNPSSEKTVASTGASTDPAGGGGHAVIPTGGAPTNQQTGGNAVVPTGGTPGTPIPTPPTQNTPQAPDTSYAGLLAALAGRGAHDSPEVIAARAALKDSQLNQADAQKQNSLNPIPIGDQTGRDAVIRSEYLAQQNALTGQLNSAVTTQGQQIGAIENAIPAASRTVSPGNIVLDAQGNPVASAPTLAPIGSQQYYSPLPNTAGGTAGQPQTYTIKAGDTLFNLAGGDQTKVAAIEAANPGIDPNNLQPGQQIKMPTSQQGTPFSAGQVQGDQALGQQYAQNVSAVNQAKAIKGQIQSYIAANPNLNPSVFTDVNSLIQLMSGKVSNPQYQTLSNYLSEYVSTLAPILGVGGDTTNLKTQIAQGFVNAAQSGQSISTVLDGIEQLANAKLGAQVGGSNSTSPAPQASKPQSSGSSVSVGGYSFQQGPDGKWSYVAQ